MDTIIIIITLTIIYMLFTLCKSNETNNNTKKENKKEHMSISERKKKHEVIDNFLPSQVSESRILIESKFHSDYMDIISAFNNLSPTQRQIFNIENGECKVTPLIAGVPTTVREVGGVVNNFIKEVNRYVKDYVPTVRNPSCGWDEPVPDPNVKSGWDKVQESLGLPGSVYNKSAGQTELVLIKINEVTKYEVKKEIKYACLLTVQKTNVRDQLIILVSFVISKSNLKMIIPAVIEEIVVMGYLSENGISNERVVSDDYYYFDTLEKNNLVPSSTVINELLKKYDTKTKIMQQRIDYTDSPVMYDDVPHQSKYNSYQVTRTIFDDILANEYPFSS